MHFVTAKGILSSKNGMNLYRGCTHGCIYCDSRSRCYHMEHAFEDIEVKENAVDLLEYALRRKRKKCMIGTGSMTVVWMTPILPFINDTKENISRILDMCGEANVYGVCFGMGLTLQSLSIRPIKIPYASCDTFMPDSQCQKPSCCQKMYLPEKKLYNGYHKYRFRKEYLRLNLLSEQIFLPQS